VSAESRDVSSDTILCHGAPGIPKCPSRARETRHDRANRQVCDIRNLTIGELFEFAQSQYFAQRARHHIKNEANGLGFRFAHQHRFRVVLVRRYIKDEFFGITLAVVIDLQTRLSPPVRQPAVIAISHNREDSGAGIPTAISSEASIGSKECLLYDIPGRGGIPAEKTREIVGCSS
jgi:hypothetical protein